MYPKKYTVTVTTDGSGNATAYSEVIRGPILAIHYVKNDFAAGVDFAITLEATGEGLWTQNDVNASASVYPRVGVHDVAGVAATLNGTQAMRDVISAADDRVKVVISSGGATKSGTFLVIVGAAR